MKLTVYDTQGKDLGSIDVDDAVFGIEPHKPAMRQALLAALANRRAGTHNTKTRGEVAGSTKKIRRQKGMGAARQGAIRAPHHRHGGIVFGPKSRSYKQSLPKMIRRLAIRSAISAKAADGELKIVRGLSVDAPRTKAVSGLFEALAFERSVLLVTAASDRNLLLSARNLPGAKVLPADYMNVADLLGHRGLVMTEEAVRRAEAVWGGERAKTRRAPKPEAVHG